MELENGFQLVYKTERNFLFYLLGGALLFIVFFVGIKAFSLFVSQEYLFGLRYVIALFFFLFCSGALMHKKVLFTSATLKKMRLHYEIFGFRFVKYEYFESIDYISVIGNKRDSDYTIKLQFLNNTSQAILFRTNYEETLALSKLLVKGLDVKLFDATDVGGRNWINIE